MLQNQFSLRIMWNTLVKWLQLWSVKPRSKSRQPKDPMQTLQEKSITKLSTFGFTGTELVKATSVLVNVPNQMTMLFALPKTLRREFIWNMHAGKLFIMTFPFSCSSNLCMLSTYHCGAFSGILLLPCC